MTVYLAFNEHVDSPINYVAANVAADTVRIRSHVRAGFRFTTTTALTYDCPIGTDLTTGWVTVYIGTRTSTAGTTNNLFGLIGQNGALLGTLRIPAVNTTITFFNNMNAASATLSTSGNRKFDIHFKIDAVDGFIYVYVDGVLTYSYTGTTTTGGITHIRTLRFGNDNGGGSFTSSGWFSIFSEVLVSDQPTINSKVITRAFTAFGDVNQFSGVLTDVNAASDADTTFISETTAGEITTFASAAIPALATNDEITAVAINYRANFEPTSPVTKLAPLVRKAGTNYIGAAQTLNNTVTSYRRVWETDPATGLPWTEAGVNAVQLGFQAQA